MSTPSRCSEPSTTCLITSGRLVTRPLGLRSTGIDVPAELGRDHHLVPVRGERLADELLVGVRTVDLGGVEEGDAAVHSGADQRDHLLPVRLVAVAAGHAHAAQPDGGDLEAVGAEGAFVHGSCSCRRRRKGQPAGRPGATGAFSLVAAQLARRRRLSWESVPGSALHAMRVRPESAVSSKDSKSRVEAADNGVLEMFDTGPVQMHVVRGPAGAELLAADAGQHGDLTTAQPRYPTLTTEAGQSRLVGCDFRPARGEKLAHLVPVVHTGDASRPTPPVGVPRSTPHGGSPLRRHLPRRP